MYPIGACHYPSMRKYQNSNSSCGCEECSVGQCCAGLLCSCAVIASLEGMSAVSAYLIGGEVGIPFCGQLEKILQMISETSSSPLST